MREGLAGAPHRSPASPPRFGNDDHLRRSGRNQLGTGSEDLSVGPDLRARATSFEHELESLAAVNLAECLPSGIQTDDHELLKTLSLRCKPPDALSCHGR